MKCRKKATILLAAFIILSFVCMAIANGIQTDGGKVAIEDGSIETDLGTLTYKLYKPETASEPPACCCSTATRTTTRPAAHTP